MAAGGIERYTRWSLGLALHLCRVAGVQPIDARSLWSEMALGDYSLFRDGPWDASALDFGDGQRYILYRDGDTSPARALWSIAHELGHLLLAHPGGRVCLETGRYEPAPSDREEEAHAFARELLLPESEMRDFCRRGLTADDVARLKGVSRTAVRVRLKRLRAAHLKGPQASA